MADAKPIEIHNVGALGIIKDLPAHTIPPEAWSDGSNVRFQDNVAETFTGHSSVFGTPSVAPGWGLNVPSAAQNYWLYFSLAKAYVYEGGIHTNITRQTASVDVDYTAAEHYQWNGGLLGGVPIINNGSDIPQYWPDLITTTKLANLPAWPSGMLAKIVKPFGPYLVALNITDGANVYPHMYWWSHKTDPGTVPASWDYTDPTKDAGRRELTDVEGGQILDALMLRNLLIIYKETSTHALRFVGGQEIFAGDLLFNSAGILAPRCVTLIDRGRKHFVVTGDDVVINNGSDIESILDRKNRKYLQNDLELSTVNVAFCAHNQAQREAWFVYPSNGSLVANKALVYNYAYGTIQFRDFTGAYATNGVAQEGSGTAWSALSNLWDTADTQWTTAGARQLIMFDPVNSLIYKADSTNTFNGAVKTAFLERTGLAIIGKDRQGQPKVNFSNRKLLKRIWPKMTSTGLVNIRCGAQEERNGAINWQDVQTFNPATQKYLDFTANGRLLCVRFESSSDVQWALEGYDLEIQLLGDH